MDRWESWDGRRRLERVASKMRRRPGTLGPGFLSCVYEDWHPSMDKRRRIDPNSNYINELPDDILQDLLSRLEVKEAVKTRAVCRRWRNLWTFSSICETSHSRRRDEYTTSGAMVVRYKKRASTMDSMILAFDMEDDCCHDYSTLSEWIQCKLSCKFLKSSRFSLRHHPNLSPPVLDTSGRLQNARLTVLYLDPVAMYFDDFANCTKLCRNLVSLVVVNAPLGLAVVGSKDEEIPRLKHLEFRYCKHLDAIGLYAVPNLESFKLANKEQRAITLYGPNPSLANVSLQVSFSINLLEELRKSVPQLKQLELSMEDLIREMSLTRDLQLPEFSNVKQLKLIFDFSSNLGLMDLALFIKACPSLQKLALAYDDDQVVHVDDDEHNKHIHFHEELMESYAHQHLRVVEFLGWCGHESEVRFANFVIKTASHLQDLVFHPRLGEGDSVKKAKASARRLIKKFKIIKSSRP